MQQDGVCGDESWRELTSTLHHLVTVTTLHIGLCPVSVVHAVAQKMVWLQHFTAESIDDASKHSGRFCFSCCRCVLNGYHSTVFVEIS